MSEKKASYEGNKATDKRHFRRKSKVKPASGQGHMIANGTGKPMTKSGHSSLTEHFKGGHG